MVELEAMRDAMKPGNLPKHDMLVCVPFTLLACRQAELASRSSFNIGAQDCHHNINGAHTGDISVEMIADCGAAGGDRWPF